MLSKFPYLAISLLLAPQKLLKPLVVILAKRSYFPSIMNPCFDLMATLRIISAKMLILLTYLR